ncbi:ComF family protein [Bacillus altitudinis]|uniref:ComF family protein n=1 Tax=Bacillus sp. GbtcB10 TaxID=2824755 RepID=UPI00166F95BC|nr:MULTISPECIES: ComF family protein [Bacillus]MCA1019162.1 ComF family protein [Bacillus stratosphericus]MCY7497757.1 ComF family protein [Bacillus altitudinis]MCY7533851.1 ComF family protein [Bacillus altitudinis]MCY7547635.1 ComF family protein [Bacillus altitudinis]MCY7555695.1 ComF family protein [Bacillus altitudinis]
MICPICESHFVAAFTWKSFLLLNEDRLCVACKNHLMKIQGPTCPKCGRAQSNDQLCQDCSRWNKRWDFAEILVMNRSVYAYNDFMKDILARFKFRGDTALADLFKKDVQSAFKRSFSIKEPVLVPIPLSKERLKERGFNQSMMLASMIGGPILEPLIKVHQSKQSKKRKNERLHQQNLFQLRQSNPIVLKDVVLIDDIYTTGATVYHAAKILKEAGAKSVSSFTLIRS